jgi:hypothetical protein
MLHLARMKKSERPYWVNIVDRFEVYGKLEARKFADVIEVYPKHQLAEELGISRQAIDHWFARGSIGASRLHQVIEILQEPLAACGFKPNLPKIEHKRKVLELFSDY